MNSTNITSAFRRYLRLGNQHVKPLTVFWRSQKTVASPLERNEIQNDSANGKSENMETVLPFEDIPGPKRTIKSMMDFYRTTEGITKAYKFSERLFAQHGRVFKEHLLRKDGIVHIIDPDDVEKVFRAEGKYPYRFMIDAWKEQRERKNFFLGLANLQGKEWQKLRSPLSQKLMRPKIVEENIDNFNNVTNDAIASFFKLRDSCGPDNYIPNLEMELYKFSLESIGTVAFDARIGLYQDPPSTEALEFIETVQNFFKYTQKLLYNPINVIVQPYMDTPTFKKFLKCGDSVLDAGQAFVAKRMTELKEMAEKGVDPSGDTQVVSLLAYLLANQDLTLKEVSGLAVDVIFAGVDTTSGAILWLLYNLAMYPHVQEKLYQEVENVLGKEGDLTAKGLSKLAYLKANVKESMRLYPVVNVHIRVLDQDIVLSGFQVPAQTPIRMELYCTCRSEKYFKDPLEFKPERWLRENKDEIHAFSSLAFGFGPRSCVGRRAAELEIYSFVSKLLQRFRLEYQGEPLEMLERLFGVPDKPVKIKFVDRT